MTIKLSFPRIVGEYAVIKEFGKTFYIKKFLLDKPPELGWTEFTLAANAEFVTEGNQFIKNRVGVDELVNSYINPQKPIPYTPIFPEKPQPWGDKKIEPWYTPKVGFPQELWNVTCFQSTEKI